LSPTPVKFDDLAPLLGLIGNELAKIGRRHRHRQAAGLASGAASLEIIRATLSFEPPAKPTSQCIARIG
jgi:hypothetical protein